MVTFEITNMLSDINVEETFKIIKQTSILDGEEMDFTNRLPIIIRIMCKQNYFTFENNYRFQITPWVNLYHL